MKTNVLFVCFCWLALFGTSCSSPVVPKTTNSISNNSTPATANHDHHGMNHNQMNHSAMQSSEGAASAPFDLQFLDTMIAHHQAAVEMAKPALAKAEHAELKTLATNIVAEQEKEIAQMKKWRDAWFAGKPAAINMEMAGMRDSMKGMEMTKLNSLSGPGYDLEFIKQMIPHHEGAVSMAQEALQKSAKAEIKTFATAIIKAQEDEIKQMKNWQTTWGK